jgi:aerobic-type carbon monoxide dehydrogenase small subunit (CoxS/CutS family)
MTSFVFHFNGKPVQALPDQTIAMALWVAGIRSLRTSARLREPRGTFCGMGVCQECVVWIDGRRCESCLTRVRPGLSVSGDIDGTT